MYLLRFEVKPLVYIIVFHHWLYFWSVIYQTFAYPAYQGWLSPCQQFSYFVKSWSMSRAFFLWFIFMRPTSWLHTCLCRWLNVLFGYFIFQPLDIFNTWNDPLIKFPCLVREKCSIDQFSHASFDFTLMYLSLIITVW